MSASLEEVLCFQGAFRAVMDAFAHPGRPFALPRVQAGARHALAGMEEPLTLLTRLFVDQATTFCVAPGCDKRLELEIAAETHAHPASPEEAAFVIVPRAADDESLEVAVMHASAGTLLSPERGATVLIGCGLLSEGGAVSGCAQIEVSGPGVKGTGTFATDRTAWERARAWRADEFPCGIDILLCDAQGQVVGVPRTAAVARRESDAREGVPTRADVRAGEKNGGR